MADVITWLEPQPSPSALPVRMANPFSGAVHPLARAAAEALQRQLPPPDPDAGQMFGVLVVAAADGRIGVLRAFSGMLSGRWLVPGFAPPLFDVAQRDVQWAAAQHAPGSPAERSRKLWADLTAAYDVPDARGVRRSLASLFAPAPAPGGAGDCAAPKLLALAFARKLRPLALAEFWWGAAARTGEHQHGDFVPACQAKCGAVLPCMLAGVHVEPGPPPATVHTLYDDAWLTVSAHPPELPAPRGLGSGAAGLVLTSKDAATWAALQQQLARGELQLRHIAYLDGALPPALGDHGVITLPLRLDANARPRRIHDASRGKAAVTDWQVIARESARTRVALLPRSSRTHQLRVHAAHALGLGLAIVGDRLYGRPAPRLLLHAESISFTHPHTGRAIDLKLPAPF